VQNEDALVQVSRPSTGKPANVLRHLAAIDGLRALAVLTVVFFHTGVHALRPMPIFPFELGQHGVELFFVISGFCLALPFLRNQKQGNDVGFDAPKFFASRIVRILPPYYVAVAIFALASFSPLWHAAASSGQLNGHVTPTSLIAHAFFAARDGQVLNASFWTLRIEAIWYLLMPLLLFAFIRSRTIFALIGLACALAAIFHVFPGSVHMMILSLPAFMLGIVAADMHVLEVAPRRALLAGLVLAGAIAIAGDVLFFGKGPGDTPWRLTWEVAAFLLVAFANCDVRAKRLFSNSILVVIGIASYSIYLIHEPVIALLTESHLPPVIAFTVALGAGYAFWWLFERTLMTGAVHRPMVAAVRRLNLAAIPKPSQGADPQGEIGRPKSVA
jgi:peptidoglycan/LPS O-acetylase OafA/YrhL